MNEKQIVDKLVILSMILLFSMILFIAIPTQIQKTEQFFNEAESHLGTDHFTVSITDFIFIATTEDGRQYPSREAVNTYYKNKIVFSFIPIAMVVLSFLSSCVLLSSLAQSEVKNDA